jgi:hypothetical protein
VKIQTLSAGAFRQQGSVLGISVSTARCRRRLREIGEQAGHALVEDGEAVGVLAVCSKVMARCVMSAQAHGFSIQADAAIASPGAI